MNVMTELLDKFPVSDETRKLAESFLRLAKEKTARGSGHYIGRLSSGLPAVCTFLACEELNNNELSRNQAQPASCLKPSDFDKLYETVKKALKGEHSYSKPSKSPSKPSATRQSPSKTALVESVSQGRLVTSAQGQETPLRRSLRNASSTPTSPTKSTTMRTPSASPTKQAVPHPWKKPPVRELPSKGSPKKRSAEQSENQVDHLKVDELSLESPTKKRRMASPSNDSNKISFPSTSNLPNDTIFVTPSKKKVPVVELIAKKYSLHKQAKEREDADSDQMDVDALILESPTKKGKGIVPLNFNSSHVVSPSKSSRTIIANQMGPSSSSSDSDSEDVLPNRRFRPIYLDQRQWNARDKRIDRLWKNAANQSLNDRDK